MKFSSNGRNRIYATYIGGDQNECPHTMYSDPQGNLVVMGRTYSTNFPFFNIFGTRGGCDMFVLKLNANGSGLLGSACVCLLYTSPSPRDGLLSRMPSSA